MNVNVVIDGASFTLNEGQDASEFVERMKTLRKTWGINDGEAAGASKDANKEKGSKKYVTPPKGTRHGFNFCAICGNQVSGKKKRLCGEKRCFVRYNRIFVAGYTSAKRKFS